MLRASSRNDQLLTALALAAHVWLLPACGGGGGELDASVGAVDAARDASTDASTPADALVEEDAEVAVDAEVAADAEVAVDAGPPDAGPPPRCTATPCESVTTTVGRLRTLDECAFALRAESSFEEGRARADALLDRLGTAGLGGHRTLTQVLGQLNRTGRAGLTSETRTRLSGLSPVGFRWNTGDDAVDYWYPQGITGQGSSLLVSWYHKTDARPTRGARLSLVDVSDLANPRYRHLLLVDPEDTARGYGPAEYDGGGALHAGGIAWVGDLLYVADTSRGLRVYDLSRIAEVANTDDTTRIGLAGGRADAHGYRYVVPRIGRWVNAGGCNARFSSVAVSEIGGQPALAVAEYRADDANGKVVAWLLDGDDLRVEGDRAWAVGAALAGQTRVQGTARVGDAWYLSSSSQDGSNGRLYRATPAGTTSVNWVYGAEDLYRDPRDRLWTAAEHPNRRDVVAIPRPR
ncbi:MAG: hypothetical protein R3B99_19515 [Polyangiales bacterium]|nr:hypothetical protein [Myxococcales bacterium]MCB9601546.1 hypothetical protein [Sandaracinus sp.]